MNAKSLILLSAIFLIALAYRRPVEKVSPLMPAGAKAPRPVLVEIVQNGQARARVYNQRRFSKEMVEYHHGISARRINGALYDSGKMAGGKRLLLGIRIPINSATITDLTAIAGIGAARAAAIAKYRKNHGPFTSIEELTKVKGIGIKGIKKIKSSIRL